jgi:hypothetical protein
MGDGGAGQQPGGTFYASWHTPAKAGSGGGGGGGGDYDRGYGTGFLFEAGYSGPAGMDGSVFLGNPQDDETRTFYKVAYGGGGTADWYGGGSHLPKNGMAGGILIGWYLPPAAPPLTIPIYVGRSGLGLNTLRNITAYPVTASGSTIDDDDFFISSSDSSVVRRAYVTPNATAATFDAVAVSLSQLIPLSPNFDGTSQTVMFGFGPLAMWVEDSGNTVYLCDPNNNAVRKMVRDTTSGSPSYSITTLAGGPNNEGRNLSDPVSTAKFSSPTSIVYNSKGNNFLVIDNSGGGLRGIDNGGKVTRFVIPGSVLAVLPDTYSTGDSTTQQFYIFVGGGTMYYYDSRDPNIDNNRLTYRAGTVTVGHRNGAGTAAQFNLPTCMIFDNSGFIIIGENSPYVRRMTTTGTYDVTDLCTIPSNFYGSTIRVTSMAYDSFGFLYMTINAGDSNSHGILRYDGTSVRMFAGAASYGYADGFLTAALFNYPSGLYYDRAYNILYVADTGNNMIRYITLADNLVRTLSGVLGQAGQINSNYGTPTYNNPTSLTGDSVGQLYVCDKGNHAIRRISPRV